jgi:hypothetical protein
MDNDFSWHDKSQGVTLIKKENGNFDPQEVLYNQTNWIRVGIFSMAGLLQLWIALRHFGGFPRCSLGHR